MNYKDFLVEQLSQYDMKSYTDYITDHLDRSIDYSEYLSEQLDKNESIHTKRKRERNKKYKKLFDND